MTNATLFSPGKIGSIPIRNRVGLAAMTRARAIDSIPNDTMKEYYMQRRNAGFILTEGTFVSPAAHGWADAPGIYTEEQIAEWKKITSAVQEGPECSPMFCQLWYTGRQSHPSFINHPRGVVSSSDIPADGETHTKEGKAKYPKPRPLETVEIQEIVEEFRQGAMNAKKAGFAGVEIHGANGYILDQFLQSTSNKRTDSYGGSIENRARIYDEVIRAVLTVFPAENVGIKLSPNGMYGSMGSKDNLEAFDYVLKMVFDFRLGFVEIMDGLAFGFHELTEPYTLERARQIQKESQGDDLQTFVIGNCGYTKEDAEKAIAKGDADAITFGRPFIPNPDLVERFQKDLKLAEVTDPTTMMTFGHGARGYSDYPTFAEESVTK